MSAPDLVTALREVVGAEHVLEAPDLVSAYATDWTGRFSGSATAVVRPGSTAEVAAVLATCHASGIAVVPQGGNTGLVGGAVPTTGGIVVSTRRLAAVGEVDGSTGQITVAAGATLAEVASATAGSGWEHPVDFAARDSATIGGTIATNAGGHRALRHGMTRRHVLGVEAVLADGRVISRLGGLLKDNTGYDLAGLLCGSEGTLAVITAARLGLSPLPSSWATALLGFESVGSLVAAVAGLRRELWGLEALELMLRPGMRAVAERLGASPPLDDPEAVLLVEVAGGPECLARLAEAAASLAGVTGSAVAVEPGQRRALWRWRELHTEVINSVSAEPPHKLDVAVPVDALGELVASLAPKVSGLRPGAGVWLFGHAGDGNLHVNLTGLEPADEEVDEAVLRLVAELGGTISAEHGVGRAKRRWLHLVRSEVEIEVFRALKEAMDPAGILNPGVLIP